MLPLRRFASDTSFWLADSTIAFRSLPVSLSMLLLHKPVLAGLIPAIHRIVRPPPHLARRFTLFVSIFNLVFGGAYIFFILKLGTSIIASIISFLGFLFILWIFWLASGASTATAYGGRFSCANESFAHCNQLLAMEAFSFINCALTRALQVAMFSKC